MTDVFIAVFKYILQKINKVFLFITLDNYFFIWKILTASRNSTQILVATTQNVVNIFFLTRRKYVQNSDILSFPCFLFWSFKIAFNFFNVCFDFSVSGHSPKSSCSNVFFNPFWIIRNNQVYKNIWTKPDVSNL